MLYLYFVLTAPETGKERIHTTPAKEPVSPPPVDEADLKSDDLMQVHERQGEC